MHMGGEYVATWKTCHLKTLALNLQDAFAPSRALSLVAITNVDCMPVPSGCVRLEWPHRHQCARADGVRSQGPVRVYQKDAGHMIF